MERLAVLTCRPFFKRIRRWFVRLLTHNTRKTPHESTPNEFAADRRLSVAGNATTGN